MNVELLAVVHVAVTAFMTGLIWTVHVVHYPLFAFVNDPYRPFQQAHMTRITRLLAAPWSLEVAAAVAMAVVVPAGWPRALALLGVGLLALILLITALGAAPIHGRLVDRFDADLLRRLLRFDLVRALLWSLRLIIAGALVFSS